MIDAQNNETAYAYDFAGQLVCQTGPAGQVSFFGYDAAGNLLQKTDGNHRVTQYTIDALGRRVEERWLDGQAQVIRTIRTKYDAAGQLWAIEETGSTASQAGATYYFEYDQDGNLRRSLVAPPDLAQPASTNTTTTPDYIANNESSKDYPVSFSLGTAVTIDLTSSRFDPHLKVVAPSGQFLEDAGNTTHASLQFVAQETGTWHVIVTSDATLPPTNRSFTLATTENTFNALAKLEYGYDEAGNLKKTTDSSTVVSNVNGTTAYDYDALQRLTRTTQSGANVAPKQADFAYNNAGQPLTISRFASTNGTAPVATTNYTTYDGMGRLKEMNHQKDQTSLATYSWQFDAASRVTQMVSLADGTNNFTYDNADQLQTASNPAENYTYDDNGNRTNAGYSTDPGNRLADDGVYTYQYDNEGNRTLRTKTADGSMTEYVWDHRNRLVSVTERPAPLPSSQWASTVIAFSTQFTDTNWSAAQALGAPNVPYYADYFQAWAPSSKDGTTEYITLGYSTPVYANAVTVRESYGNGFVTNVEVRNAATGAFESVWSGTDPSQPGSLVDFTVTFATRSYLVDAVRVTTNTSHSEVWEDVDAVQLSGLAIAPATKAVEYTYDAFGQRIRRTIDADGAGSGPAVYTYNVYSGGEAVLEIKDLDGLANATLSPTRNHRYFYGAAVDQVLASEDAAQAVLWGLADHEGTIRDVVDSSGTVVDHRTFDSFGKITYESAPATDFLFGYTGRPQDAATGLDDYRGRWYDPAVGRFASEDPAGFAAGDANLYRYVGNNPLTHSDPSGLGEQGLSQPMSLQSTRWPQALTVEERLALSRERAQREVDYFHATMDVVQRYGRNEAPYLEYLERLAEVAAEYGDLLLLERCRQAYAWELAHPRTQSKRGVGAPGFVEGFIPVWGSGRASLNYYQEGRWVWGTVHLGLAVTDVFLVKSLVTAGGKLVFGGTTRAVAAVGGRTLEGAEVRAAESLATQRALRTRALDEAGNLAHSAPSALGGRAQRAAQYGSNWQAASLEKAIARHAGENYTTWVTESGKRVFENPATGRQVVCDIEGGYFRIFQPKTIGSSQGTYLNLMGREVTPAMRVKGGAIKSVPLRDVDKGMWQAETHFWAE